MRLAVFHELPFGGARRVVLEHVRRLVTRHQVDVYYTATLPDAELETVAIASFRFPFVSREWHGKDWKSRLYKDTLELFALARLHRQIATQIDAGNYDYVIVHPSSFTQAPFILPFLKTPSLYYCHEPLRSVHDPEFSRKNIYDRVVSFVRGKIDAHNQMAATKVATNSNFTKNWIMRAYGREATVIYPGVDGNFFRPQKVSKKYDIGFFGAPVAIEGYDLLLEAQKYLPEHVNICTIKRDGQGKGISDAQLATRFCRCRVVVALSCNEPLGLIPLEAAACGVSVVAVDEGGYKETVVPNYSGILIRRDAKALAQAILKLLQDEKLCLKLGRQARAHVLAHWTWEKSTKDLEALLQTSTVSTNSPGGSLFLIYFFTLIFTLFLFRMSFRFVRPLFPVATGSDGIVGYAQYFHLSLSFETLYFNAMFLSPILIAILFRIFLVRKKS